MKKFDNIFFGLVIAPVLPIVFFLGGWWSCLPFVPEKSIWMFMLGGLLFGCVLDFLFLKPILNNIFKYKSIHQIIIYMFYTICVFGFFMGVPVFNVFLGIVAGLYAARKASYDGLEFGKSVKYINRVSIFTTVVIVLICIAAAYLALTDPYTSGNLEGMFKLNFEITQGMLYALTVTGGLLLVLLQYFITKLSAIYTLKHQIR